MSEQYSVISKYYELLNSEVCYDDIAEFLDKAIKKYASKETKLVLDLACGTGTLTRALARLGYDMAGVDLSIDMLAVANEHEKKDKQGILYLCQDMRDFELYGTVDAAVCCLDSINYLLKGSDVCRCFSLVHNYLIPEGLFIFDVNSPHRFEKGYAGRDFVMEEDGVLLAWQNFYNFKTHICDFVLSLFCENEDGRYTRYDEEQRERMYTMRSLKGYLAKSGFEIIDVFSGYDFRCAGEEDDRWLFVCRCKK